jgi:hypothetical protein
MALAVEISTKKSLARIFFTLHGGKKRMYKKYKKVSIKIIFCFFRRGAVLGNKNSPKKFSPPFREKKKKKTWEPKKKGKRKQYKQR